jgi:hypothetical protein
VCIYLGEYPCKPSHWFCCCVLPSIQKHKSRWVSEIKYNQFKKNMKRHLCEL